MLKEVIDLSDRVSGSLLRIGNGGGGEGRWEGSEGPKLLFQDWEDQKAASHRATAGQNISQDGGTAQTWQTVFGVEKGSDTVFFRGMSCE